jgi:hypothetical protein
VTRCIPLQNARPRCRLWQFGSYPRRALAARTRRICGNSSVSRLARGGARAEASPRKHSDWVRCDGQVQSCYAEQYPTWAMDRNWTGPE